MAAQRRQSSHIWVAVAQQQFPSRPARPNSFHINLTPLGLASPPVQLLPETVLHRSMRDKWAAVQLSAHRVQLEHEGGTVLFVEVQ